MQENQNKSNEELVNYVKTLQVENKTLSNQILMFQMTDFYRRAEWLWNIMKEGKTLGLDESFIETQRNEFMDMFTPKNQEVESDKA